MASLPSFAGLKSISPVRTCAKSSAVPIARSFSVKSSSKDAAVAAAAAIATSAMLASNALAVDVLLGGDDGSLAFVPNEFSIAAGDKIVFKNNAGFPHNIVFDEDEVPPGVDASALSMKEDDLLNGPGESYTLTLKEKGTYSFYCAPHQGAGMVGKVTVK